MIKAVARKRSNVGCRPTSRTVSLSTLSTAVLSALYGAAIAAPSPGPAPAAASSTASDEGLLQEVTVTATRRSVSAQDLPISITAVSGGTLEAAGIQDIASLAHSVAGVDYTDKGPFGGVSGSTLIIRGLNSEGTGSLALATSIVPPVATYVDETPLFFNLRLQDLDHVEILRGPQGTLYGSGSLGGTLRFVQNAPDPSGFDAKVEMGMSKTQHAHAPNEDVNGMLNLPLSDTFAIRLNASFTNEGGYISQRNLYQLDGAGIPLSATPGDTFSQPIVGQRDGVNSYGYRSARVSALWKPSDDLKAQLSYYYQRSTGAGFPTEAPAVYGSNSLASIDYAQDGTEDRVNLVAFNLEYNLGFATLTSATSYAHHHNETSEDLTALYTSFSFYTPYYGANPRAFIVGHQALNDELFAQEFRLASKPGGKIDWVTGAFFKNQRTYIQEHEFYPGYDDFSNACAAVYGFGSNQCGFGEYYDVAPQVNGVPTVTPSTPGSAGIPLVKDQAYIGDVHTRFKDYALFGEVTWHIFDKLSLTGGTRLFKQTVDQSQQTGLLFDGPDFAANGSLSDEFRRPLWKINSSYQFDKSNLAYVTWSQGFRRGGVNALPPQVIGETVDPRLSRLAPDKVDNYEIGFKGTVSNRLRYSVAVFDMEWHNFQEGVQLTPLVLPGAINLGNAASRGVELEVAASLTRHLDASIGYTYDETVLYNYTDVASTPGNLSVGLPPTGGRLPGTPLNSLALNLEYGRINLGEGELRFAVDGHYQSRVLPAISESVPTVAGYTLWNFRTSYQLSHWTGSLFVNNLADARAITSYTDPANYGGATTTYGIPAANNANRYSALVSQPRTYGFSVAYSFKGR